MANRPRRIPKAFRADSTKSPAVARADDWSNVATGLGVASYDKRMSASVATAYRWSQAELMELWKGDPVAALIVDDRAQEMLRKWFTLELDDSIEDGARTVMDAIDGVDGLPLRQKLFEWIRNGRRDGGSALYLGIDDGNTPDKPVNLDNVRSCDFVNVIDRWSLQPYSYYANRLQPKYGEVAQYQLSGGFDFGGPPPPDQPRRKGQQPTQLVHADRILRWDGVELGAEESLKNSGWGDSVLTRVREIVRDDTSLWQSLGTLMTDYSTPIMKMRDLAQALAVPDGQKIVQGRMAGVQLARSVARITLLDGGSGNPGDTGEEWSRDTIALSGVADVIDRFMQRVAMAARMPVSRLFGVTPGGLNDKGGSDLQWYHEDIERSQVVELQPRLNKLLRVLMKAQKGPLKGNEPKRWSIKFNPLRQMTEIEQAELRKSTAETDQIYYNMGALDPREIRKSRFGGPTFSTETQIDAEIDTLLDEKHQAEAEAALKSAERTREGEPSPDVAAKVNAQAAAKAASQTSKLKKAA